LATHPPIARNGNGEAGGYANGAEGGGFNKGGGQGGGYLKGSGEDGAYGNGGQCGIGSASDSSGREGDGRCSANVAGDARLRRDFNPLPPQTALAAVTAPSPAAATVPAHPSSGNAMAAAELDPNIMPSIPTHSDADPTCTSNSTHTPTHTRVQVPSFDTLRYFRSPLSLSFFCSLARAL
jgi:hypothetical protein